MIRSRYSHIFKTSKGDALIYISKGNSFMECDQELYLLLSETEPGKAISEKLIETLPQEVRDTLENVGFICREYDDEDYFDMLRFVSEASQHDKSTLGMIVVPTLDCNFACPYCFEKNKRATYMSPEIEQRLCDFIIECKGNKPITLYWYGGEPLLASDSIQRILNNLKGKVEIDEHVLISNGYLLTEDKYDVFDKSFPLKSIQITLDGNTERHNKLRALKYGDSKETYNQIVENIKKYASTHPKCTLHVRVNVDKNNYKDYEEAVRVFAGLDLKNIQVYPGMIRLENREMTHCIEPAFGRWEIAELHYQQLVNSNREKELYPQIVHTKNCSANRVNSYIVGPEGEIYKCWNDVSNKNAVVGNITKNEITNQQLYYRYHSSCMCFNDPECAKCFYLPICNGKCSWYQLKNKYFGGQFNLCQCLMKAPGMRNKVLETYYEHTKQQ